MTRTRQQVVEDARALANAIPDDASMQARTLRVLASLVADLAEATLEAPAKKRRK